MDPSNDDYRASLLESEVSRRTVMKYSAGGLAVALGGWRLSAGSSRTKTDSASASSSGAALKLTADEKHTLLKMIGPIDSKYSGKGKKWKIGAAFPFTGPYGYYEIVLGDGLKLAAQQIPQLGGPTIDIDFQNFGGSDGIDTQLAVDDVLSLHDAGVGLCISSIGAAAGAMLPGVARYKILDLEAGGGIGTFANKPYYWDARSNYPVVEYLLIAEYLAKAMPKLKKCSIIGNSGASYAPDLAQAVTVVEKVPGFRVVGTPTLPLGTTDWSTTFPQITAQNPEFILLEITGNDAAYFMKQYVTSGLKQPVFGVSWSTPQAQIAGARAFEGMYFALEDFVPDEPSNEWGKIFAKYYRRAFPAQGTGPASPLNLSANYYTLGFMAWALARRVLAKGGDINSGPQLQQALRESPEFPAVFGGAGMTPGTIAFDTSGPNGHGVKSAPLGLFQIRNNRPVLLATDSSTGGQLKIVSK